MSTSQTTLRETLGHIGVFSEALVKNLEFGDTDSQMSKPIYLFVYLFG